MCMYVFVSKKIIWVNNCVAFAVRGTPEHFFVLISAVFELETLKQI